MLSRRDFLALSSGGMLGLLRPGSGMASTLRPPPVVEPAYFGLHMTWPVREPYMQNFPDVPVGAWRGIAPEIHWFSLEPGKGIWKFDKLDLAVRMMTARKVEIMLTLGQPAAWASAKPGEKGPYVYGQNAPPRDIADWESYVRTVARRYRGRIRSYELWNEPAVREVDGDKADFDAAKLVELGRVAYRAIKQEDPAALLTTPAMVGGPAGVARMDAYFAAGGSKCADVVAFHFYGMPEEIVTYQTELLRVMEKHGVGHLPVWNTEFGYLIRDPTRANTFPPSGGSFSRVLPEEEAAAWLGRSMAIAASVGISRFFWFMWDGANVGLTTWVGHRVNAAGVAFGTMARWMTGMRVGELQSNGDIVTCRLMGSGGEVSLLAWTRDYGRLNWAPPPVWKDSHVEHLNGNSFSMVGRKVLELSAGPVLLSHGRRS